MPSLFEFRRSRCFWVVLALSLGFCGGRHPSGVTNGPDPWTRSVGAGAPDPAPINLPAPQTPHGPASAGGGDEASGPWPRR